MQSVPQTVPVAGGSVIIGGPAGYCVERSATRADEPGVFVLLGSCASIANDARQNAPLVAGALTASVSAQSNADFTAAIQRLEAFFETDPGRAALARDGNALSVTVLSTEQSGDVFVMKIRDVSPNAISGLAPDYWRAIFPLRGRIITLSVNSFQGNPMPDADGFTTLMGFVARIRLENPAPVDPANDPV